MRTDFVLTTVAALAAWASVGLAAPITPVFDPATRRQPKPAPTTRPAPTSRPAPTTRPGATSRPAAATPPAATTRPGATTRPALPAGGVHSAMAGEVRRLVEGFRAGRLKLREDAKADLLALHGAFVEALSEYRNDPDPEVRARVAEVLAETIAAARFERVLVKLPADQVKKLLSLRTTHPELVHDVFSLSFARRLAAVERIGKMRDRAGVAEPLVVMCLRHPWAPLAAAAIAAAGDNEYKSPAIVDSLLRILREAPATDWQRGWYDRTGKYPHIAAMEALKKIKPKHAAPAILAMMPAKRSGDARRTLALADLIASTGEIRAIPALMDGLKDTSTYSTWSSGKTKVTMARSDGALMALVKLTNQAPESYKFVTYPHSSGYQPIYGFPDTKARKAAIERFTKWWAEHKDQPPYKGLVPLPPPAPEGS